MCSSMDVRMAVGAADNSPVFMSILSTSPYLQMTYTAQLGRFMAWLRVACSALGNILCIAWGPYNVVSVVACIADGSWRLDHVQWIIASACVGRERSQPPAPCARRSALRQNGSLLLLLLLHTSRTTSRCLAPPLHIHNSRRITARLAVWSQGCVLAGGWGANCLPEDTGPVISSAVSMHAMTHWSIGPVAHGGGLQTR